MPSLSPLAALMTLPFTIQVGVSNNGMETEDSWANLILSDAPVLKRATPTAGLNTGGTTITILGEGFLDLPSLSCMIGGIMVSAAFFDSGQIYCHTPPFLGLAGGNLEGDHAEKVVITVSNNGVHYSELGLGFIYVPAAIISSIFPRVVSVEDVINGRAVATVSGTGFIQYFEEEPGTEDYRSSSNISTNITCRFGNIGDSVAVIVRSTMITCPLPAVTASEGMLLVTVSINGQDYPSGDNGATLALVMKPQIRSIFPEMGSYAGGTVVHVFGDRFSIVDLLMCTFQFRTGTAVNVAAEFEGRGLVSCITPPVPFSEMNGTSAEKNMVPATVSIGISDNHFSTNTRSSMESDFAGLRFTFFVTPNIHDLLPRIGIPTTLVDVVGEGFLDTPGLMCRFGEIPAVPVAFKGTHVVTCKAPRQANNANVVPVEVSNNMVDWTTNGVNFTYRPRTVLDSVTPKVGPVNGSTIVRVTGVGFPPHNSSGSDGNSISCRFGPILVPVMFAAEGEFFCVSPATDSPKSVSFKLVEGEVDLTDSGWHFNYLPNVKVSNAYPLSGPEVGGTAVSFTGLEFLGLESVVCQFGAPRFRVPGRWLSRREFLCDTPPQRPGSVQLAISTNGQQFTDVGLIFAYQPRATIRSVSPSSGSFRGGTVIALSGAGFIYTEEIACLVGQRLGEATYINSTLVMCRVPQAERQDSGSYAPVRIANNGVDFTDDLGVNFQFVPSFELHSIEPTVGPSTGGTTLRVSGVGFGIAGNVSCVVGGTIVETLVETTEQLACSTPPVKKAGFVKIELTSNRVDMSSSTANFRYHSPIKIASVYPSSASENGGSKLLVSGSGFTDTPRLACIFNFSTSRGRPQIESIAVYISENLISCISPEGNVGGVDVRVTNNGIDISTSLALFTIDSASTVTTLWPSSGSIDGGTTVQVQGTGFIDSPTIFCKFGDNIVSANAVPDYTGVVCTAPPQEDPAQVVVEVTRNGFDWTASGVKFTYLPSINILKISPKIGPIGGGTIVQVKGSGFEAAVSSGKMSCRFGRNVVSATAVDVNGVVLCVAPASSRLGGFSLEVSNNGIDFTSDGWTFHYSPDVIITSVWPLAGPESGGTAITITGTGFAELGIIICEFGTVGTLVRGRWIDSTTISCISPPSMPGKAPLRLTMDGQQFIESHYIFTYLMESTIQTLSPSSGPRQGGTKVEVVGTGFVNSTGLSCHLADRRLPAMFVNSGYLWCMTPPSASSLSLPLEMSNNGADFTSSGILFSFVPAMEIRHAWPMNGPVSGGTVIVVHGSGFSVKSHVFCSFGGKETLSTVRGDNELSCPTPRRGSTGSVQLELTNNGVDKVLSSNNFTYAAPISLTSVNPSRSGEEGGTSVVIIGDNFIASPSLTCRFGREDATPASWLSSTRVSCLIPASPGGPHDVSLTVSNNAQDFAFEPLVFTYLAAFTLTKIEPIAGPVDGGTEVTLTGTGLSKTGPWACVFGQALAVAATQLMTEHLRCRSPLHPPGQVQLRVFRSPSPLGSAVSGAISAATIGTLQDFGLSFEYQDSVFISSVEPRSGSSLGGTPVTLRGFGFENAAIITCGFGEQNGELLTSPAVQASTGLAVCSSPPHSPGKRSISTDGPFVVSVALSLNGDDFSGGGPQYVYYKPVQVLGLFPAVGSANGGTVVTVVGQQFLPSEDLSCRFGAFAVSPAEFISSEAIRCSAPPSPNGPINVEVVVSNNLLEFSDSSAVFDYRPQARPLRFMPTAGPLSGGTLIAIEGSGFSVTLRLACRFGSGVVKANLESPTLITCRAPKSTVEKNVPVQVTINGADWEDIGTTPGRTTFTYYRPPEVTKLSPSTGPQMGGTLLSIFGRNLKPVLAGYPVICRVGNTSVASHNASAALSWGLPGSTGLEDVVTCMVPDLRVDDFTRVEVAVSTDGGVYFSSTSLIFTYVQVSNRAKV